MAFPDQFALRWNDFVSNVTSSFHSLLEQKDMVDVTLAADGQYLYAHKLILSISSPYFKQLFKVNPCEHPIVILKDVTFQELQQLLQFMYYGEVHINRQDLSRFLQTAELLQVKGLSSPPERPDSTEPIIQMDEPVRVAEPPAESTAPFTPAEEAIANEPSPEPTTVKEEPPRSPLRRLLKNSSSKNRDGVKKEARSPAASPSLVENNVYNPDNEPVIDFDNDLFPSVMLPDSVKDATGWNCTSSTLVKGVKCPNCHRFFANRYNLKVHIRDKHDTREGTLQCEICKKRMRNPSCLRVHMYHHRKQAAYLAQVGRDGQMKSPVPMEGSNDKVRIVTSLWGADTEGNENDSFPSASQQAMNINSDPAPKSESDLEEV